MGKRSTAGRPRLWEQAGILPSQPPESESGEWSEDSDTEWYKDICPEEAGATLVELLVNLHLEGKLSAKNLCVLCFYAEKAGVSAAKDLSYKPDTKAVGHFSRHVGRILGSNRARFQAGEPRVHEDDHRAAGGQEEGVQALGQDFESPLDARNIDAGVRHFW